MPEFSWKSLEWDEQDNYDVLPAALKHKFPALTKSERKVAAMREYQDLEQGQA